MWFTGFLFHSINVIVLIPSSASSVGRSHTMTEMHVEVNLHLLHGPPPIPLSQGNQYGVWCGYLKTFYAHANISFKHTGKLSPLAAVMLVKLLCNLQTCHLPGSCFIDNHSIYTVAHLHNIHCTNALHLLSHYPEFFSKKFFWRENTLPPFITSQYQTLSNLL